MKKPKRNNKYEQNNGGQRPVRKKNNETQPVNKHKNITNNMKKKNNGKTNGEQKTMNKPTVPQKPHGSTYERTPTKNKTPVIALDTI